MIGKASKQQRYLVIAGPTASGKSTLAHQLALKWQGEIVNCDSVQLYKGFDIGAAKPSRAEQEEVRYHLVDRLAPEDPYDARLYADEASQLISGIIERGHLPIVVGGTGLYLRALWGENWHDLPKSAKIRGELGELSNEALYAELQRLDPSRAAKLHVNDRFRLLRGVELARIFGRPVFDELPAVKSRRHESVAIKIERPRAELHQRIGLRVNEMLAAGLVAEVRALRAAGCPFDSKPMQSIGYRQVADMLDGRLPESDLAEKIAAATRQYAKRQETWFRKIDFDVLYRSGADESQLHGLCRDLSGL